MASLVTNHKSNRGKRRNSNDDNNNDNNNKSKKKLKIEPFNPGRVEKLGISHGWKISTHVKKSNNGMIAMEKEEVRINIWPSTCMVGTYLLHPQQGKTQLYRGRNTYEELEQIFKNPRTHTSKGYKTKPYKKTGNDILLASRNAIEKNEPNKNSEWVKKAIQNCIDWSQSSLNSDDCLLKYNNNNKHTKKGHLEKHKKDKHVKDSSDANQISHYNKVEQNYLNVEVQLSELVKECKNELSNNDSSSNSSSNGTVASTTTTTAAIIKTTMHSLFA